MHEWHITERLLDQVCAQARENQINKITKIQVDLGKDSHITEESLRFCFQLLREKTIAKEAVLEINSSPGDALTLVSFEGDQL
ncbi:hydrogenase maturation nickel metallochaperone HypA [Dehalococcoidales bacterium]|nr:hydrogenase maturation nickel metallochaperone HypA [Dehalococcoidales bacterium]